MNAQDILKYGNLTVCHTIEGLDDGDWTTGGVCGVWSVKDIIGHLAAYERVLIDVFNSFLHQNATPYLDLFRAGPGFNDAQAAQRQDHPDKARPVPGKRFVRRLQVGGGQMRQAEDDDGQDGKQRDKQRSQPVQAFAYS